MKFNLSALHFRLKTLDLFVVAAISAVAIIGFALLYWLLAGPSIVINNELPAPTGPVSALSGIACPNAARRPVAVMLSSDAEARPLSGIGAADMVFEMPVTPNGITRLMAVFQCNDPREIGSIRSARGSFVPLAQGLDAILVHWGGERDTLQVLNGGRMDNVDALKYEGTTFYRKNGVPAPHDGFTTPKLIAERAGNLGYRATTSLDPYLHALSGTERNLGSIADEVRVDWPQGMRVSFVYDGASNTYLRNRGGKPEMDVLTNRQVQASVVIVMQADAEFLYDQYISVHTTGRGVAAIWQAGRRTSVLWQKEKATDMLRFTDAQGRDIALEPGTVWVLIDAPLPTP